jgi:hypothetical protein
MLHYHTINVTPSCESLQMQKTLGRLQILLDAHVPLHDAYGAELREVGEGMPLLFIYFSGI